MPARYARRGWSRGWAEKKNIMQNVVSAPSLRTSRRSAISGVVGEANTITSDNATCNEVSGARHRRPRPGPLFRAFHHLLGNAMDVGQSGSRASPQFLGLIAQLVGDDEHRHDPFSLSLFLFTLRGLPPFARARTDTSDFIP